MLSERFTTKGYECTKCQAIHFEFETLYLNHLRLQSKNGIASYAPSAVAMVVDARNLPQAHAGRIAASATFDVTTPSATYAIRNVACHVCGAAKGVSCG